MVTIAKINRKLNKNLVLMIFTAYVKHPLVLDLTYEFWTQVSKKQAWSLETCHISIPRAVK